MCDNLLTMAKKQPHPDNKQQKPPAKRRSSPRPTVKEAAEYVIRKHGKVLKALENQ